MTTNYEKIKNMSVEEMAKFMHKVSGGLNCDTCPVKGKCRNICINNKKKWLKQEAE